jgi:hypothetical protein
MAEQRSEPDTHTALVPARRPGEIRARPAVALRRLVGQPQVRALAVGVCGVALRAALRGLTRRAARPVRGEELVEVRVSRATAVVRPTEDGMLIEMAAVELRRSFRR